MDDDEEKLHPRLCPLLLAWGRGFDFSEFLKDFDIPVDLAWRAGDILPFDDSHHPVPMDGFAIYLVEQASTFWQQEANLERILHENYIAFSSLRGEPVDLVAVLYPYEHGEFNQVSLEPALLGMLGGMGISLDLRRAKFEM